MSNERRESILRAAQETFVHYGFQRASMDAIAQDAGISRSGLYHHFRSKEDILLALIEALENAALARAQEAAKLSGELESRLLGVLEAKLGWFFELLQGTRHGPELLDESGRLAGELIAACRARYLRLLTGVLREADRNGQLDLGGAHTTPAAAAEFLVRCGEGLQQPQGEALTGQAYRERLRLLVHTSVRGWRSA